MKVLHPDLEASYPPEEVEQVIDRLMQHPVLQQEGILPALSRLQLSMAHFILAHVGLPAGIKNRVIGALLLIYHGLAMHDDVMDSSDKPSQNVQLTILGGDYLSALFYKLLADAGRVDLIHVFAQAIARINHAKTSILYSIEREDYDEQKLMADLESVQGSLLFALCRAVNADDTLHAIVQAAVSVDVYEERLLGRLPMREAVTWLTQRLSEARMRLKSLTVASLGAEGWLQLERLAGFSTSEFTTAVEGN
ncbi:MAG: heptaprenyl diphosphate synthase component 1 [Firmicutes bacterium]|nr:heptaprenyl diphosphate synthase component 1 [Bacillota bacterium]